MKNVLLLAFFIFLMAITTGFFTNHKQKLKQKPYLGNNHPYCLTGISSENKNLLKNEEFAIINIFIAWLDDFPQEFSGQIYDKSILMITWEPYLKNFEENSILPDILTGKYDNIIRNFAQSCKSYGKPLIIRFGHEMNGNWYPWSGERLNKNPETYKNAHKKVYNTFQKEHCENVKFVFCINHQDVPGNKWNRFENYYPGNEYVDYMGIDIYNWGNTQKWGKFFWNKSQWKNPDKLIEKPYRRILKMSPEKPILLCEVGTTSHGGNKEKWIKAFFKSIKNEYTSVKGFIWFDYSKETDWGISHDNNIWQLYKKMTNDKYFIQTYTGDELINER